jgi:hypothetical protein
MEPAKVTARIDLSLAGVGEPVPESNDQPDQPEPEECTDE